VRLDYLCSVDWAGYQEQEIYGGPFLLLHPYGTNEGVAIGELTGTVSGEKLRGDLRCINHPRARSDGVFLPDIHGVIRTADGARIICTFQGRSVFSDPQGDAMMRVTLAAETEQYRWLNNAFCVYEGVVNPRPRGRIYVCVNELVSAGDPARIDAAS
jgi:hypothetical protein